MKNLQTTVLTLTLTLLCLASACKTASENANGGNTNSATRQTNTKPEQTAAPAIETTPAELGKEWLANREEADRKYKGKTLAVTGEVSWAQETSNQAFIDFVGVEYDGKTAGVKITCVAAPTSESRLLIKAIDTHNEMKQTQKDYKVPKYTATFKGVYERSSTPERLDGFIELNPCELTMK